jgi:predicted nucleic acid-binding protein
MALIVDASVAVAWAVETQAEPMTRSALTTAIAEGFHVPHHFPIEVAHVLLRAERNERASRNDIDLFLLDLRKMKMRLDEPSNLDRLDAILTLGRRYMLTGYDAAYLEMVLRMRMPIATRDKALAQAIVKSGAQLFGVPE